ncbi:hypothetical protein D3C74_382700 [compost metagenome]
MPLWQILQRPGHDCVSINQLGPPVLFHLLSFITHGKNNGFGENPAMLSVAGDPICTKLKMAGFSMFVYADTICAGLMNQTVQHPEWIGFCIAFGIECRRLGEGVMSPDLVFLPEFRVKPMCCQVFILQPQLSNILRETGI